MYSRLMKIDQAVPTQIMHEIKKLLLSKEVPHEK